MKKLLLVLSLLNCVCGIYAQQKKIDSLRHLISISKADTSTVFFKCELADIYLNNKPDSSFLLAQEGLTQSKKKNFLKGQIWCDREIGEAKQQMGNYPGAMQDYLQYFQIAEKLNSQYDIAAALINIGFLYREQGDYSQAIKYTLKAKNVIENIPNYKKIDYYQELYDSALTNAGFFYYKNNQLDSALVYEQSAFELALKIHADDYMGNILLHMGLINEKLNNKSLAITYYRMSLQKSEAVANYTTLTDAYLSIGNFYNLTGQPDSSIFFYKNALKTAKTALYPKGILDASTNLANLYGKTDKGLAYDYLQTAAIAKDSLFNQEKVKQLQKLKFEEQVREQEIAELKTQREEERKNNLQLSLIALFIPVFFLVSLLLGKIKVHHRIIEFMSVLSILFLFEFFTLLIDPIVRRFSSNTPLIEFLIFVCLAAIMVPTHHHLTTWLKIRLTNLQKWEKHHLPGAHNK